MHSKYLLLTLVMFISFYGGVRLSLGQPAADAGSQKIRQDVVRLGKDTTEKIEVKMNEGTKLKGYIRQILDDSFDLTDAKTKQSISIPYREVAKVRRSGWSNGAKIALGVGIAGAIVTAIVVGVSAKRGLSNICPLGCGPF